MSTRTKQSSIDAESLHVVKTELDSNIYLEAGAGTGKTTALVARIVSLIDSGVSIEKLVSITFTRAAASELRMRIRQELESLNAASPEDIHLAEVLDNIGSAAFQTIDALAISILQEFPVEAQLPPDITIMEGIGVSESFDERWREWIGAKLDDDDQFVATLARSMRLGMRRPLERLAQVVKILDKRHGAPIEIHVPETEVDPVSAIEQMSRDVGRLSSSLVDCRDQEDPMFIRLSAALEWWSRTVSGREKVSDEDAEVVLTANPFVGFARIVGNQSKWEPEALTEVREMVQDVRKVAEEALESSRSDVAWQFAKIAAEFVGERISERRNAGTLTFNDSLVCVIELLERDDRVRRIVQSRYRHVLVDEFQDTSPLQTRFIELLTVPIGASRPAKGAYFSVGDLKQSIYGFRGADVANSFAAREYVESDADNGVFATLRENHRSSPKIIEWVNCVFGQWMRTDSDAKAGSDGVSQVPWLDLESDASAVGNSASAGVYHFGGELDVADASELRGADAADVAAIILAICGGAVEVRGRDGVSRRSEPGDIALITRRRTGWEHYSRALRSAGVPFELDNEADTFHSQVFNDLLNCITAIDDPSHQPATVGALRSMYFACSDVDLQRWASCGGKFSCIAQRPRSVGPDPVREALDVLRDFHEARDELTPAVLIESLIRKRQIREILLMQADPEKPLARIDLAVELARGFAAAGASSLRECIRRFNRYRDSDETFREDPIRESGSDKVRLMTVHNAKGLEFPVVILPELGGNLLVRSSPVYSGDGQSSFGVRIGTSNEGYFKVGDWEELREADVLSDQLENVRIHYVAATRARDVLIVSRNRKRGEDKSVAAQIERYAESELGVWSPVPEVWEGFEFEAAEIAAEVEPPSIIDRSLWLDEHDKAMSEASKSNWVIPSRLKGGAQVTDFELGEEKAAAEPAWDGEPSGGRGRAATAIGRAVHGAMQVLLESINEEWQSVAMREAKRHGVVEFEEEICDLVQATLQTPLMKRVMKMPPDRFWVEVPVVAPFSWGGDGSGMLDGRIDLMYALEAGRFGIVDFKTDAIFDRAVDEMAVGYEPQLGAYAYAIERATGVEVMEACIVFSRVAMDDPSKGEYWLPDLNRAKKRAMDLAATEIAGSA